MTETAEPPFLSLQDFATLAGRARWFHQRLFEVLGGWVVDEPDAEARRLFHTHSFHAAWHADLWAGLVPLLPDRPVEAVTRPASPELADIGKELAAVPGERSLERLAVAYMVVLPGLIGYCEAIERNANPVSEGPTIRLLGLLLHDLRRDADAGMARLEARIESEPGAEGAIAAAKSVGERFVACGGPLGSLPGA